MTRSLAVVLLAAPLALSGCSLLGMFKTQEQQRIDRQREKPLEVPPDLTTPTIDDRFAIPDPKASTSFSQYSQGRGPGAAAAAPAATPGVLPAPAVARIERAGEQRWVVAKAEPAQVWTVVRNFWLEMGYTFAKDDPAAGILETHWRMSRPEVERDGIRGMVSRALPGMYANGDQDRFRTRLEKGQEPGTTEIYVSHRGLEEVFANQYQDSTKWQARGSGSDKDLEAEMLQRIVVKLGAPEAKADATRTATTTPVLGGKAPAAAAPAAASRNATLEGGGAGPLVVNDGFDRAWRRVGLALDRVGFTVEDRDRSKGLYFVRYIDPEADNAPALGLVDKLAFWRAAPKSAAPQYRIRVFEAAGGATQVTVQDVKGEPEKSATGKRILALLFEQLK